LPVRVTELEPAEAVDQQDRDVCDLLRADDEEYYVAGKGDESVITFREPPQLPGTAGSLLLRARRYYTLLGL
jgi:hypothetical protein